MTGEHLGVDLRALIELLAKHRVRYLVVGGEAVIHHGYARLTADLDLFFDPSPDNARRLFAALSAFWDGAVPGVESAAELAEPGVVVQFGRAPMKVDLISSLGTVPFARAWRGRVRERMTLSARRRVELPFIGLRDLVQSKRDAGRHKDLDDVEHLEPLLRAAKRPRARQR